MEALPCSPACRPPYPQVLLKGLLWEVFGAEEVIAGRGEARRAARAVATEWEQNLTPEPPCRMIATLLREAPFLDRDVPGATPAGPAIAGAERWSARGQWGLAADRVLARDGASNGAEERFRCAVALRNAGRFEGATRYLARLGRPEAAVLRAECLLGTGELGRLRSQLRRMRARKWSGADLVRVARVAIRAGANSGDPDSGSAWVDRAARNGNGVDAVEFDLLRAEASWDRGDLGAAAAALGRSRRALRSRRLAWRWRQARALVGLSSGRPAAAARALTRALAEVRRRLRPDEAGGLWNDLALARAGSDDLPGAERACRHASRLLGGCEGRRRATLALCNLAEIRLRRGRFAGVADAIERSRRLNRDDGNRRGAMMDRTLWIRWCLARGANAEAIRHAEAALGEHRSKPVSGIGEVLSVLLARALTACGRTGEAGLLLDGLEDVVAREFEPEERPALWALAGRPDAARLAAVGPTRELWRALLSGESVPDMAWRALDDLEPYRAARMLVDVERAFPGRSPAARRAAAGRVLEEAGAPEMAAGLTAAVAPGGAPAGAPAVWSVLREYLDRSQDIVPRLGRLLAGIGHGAAELTWECDGEVITCVAGPGGTERLEAPCHGGRWVLRTDRLDDAVRVAFDLIRRDLPRPVRRRRASPVPGVVGRCAELLDAFDRLERLAAGEMPVLVLGETGTGKELAARRVHESSGRASGPWLPVNCAAMSESLIVAELFGHVRGAFTGADRDRAGIFESARGGTVFLDEIGDLPVSAQGKLLRVLQEGEVRRVGESRCRRVDIRVVAATHRDLGREVECGRFRRDLYFRLRVGSVELPPLRRRGRDVLRLAEHFLRRPGDESPRLTPEAERSLLGYAWPGNVRELQNVLAVASTLAGVGGAIEPEHLELPAIEGPTGPGYHERIEDLRRSLVREALDRSEGNRAEAARTLGLSRQALSYLVRRLGL